MDIDVSVSKSGKYLLCRVHVPITIEVAHKMALALNQLADETGIYSRLIDTRGMPNLMSVVKNYDLAYKDMDELRIARSTKVASLADRNDSLQEFAHNAIRNAGFNLRVFHEEDPAIVWLEADDV
jgi:hypothetical protein